MLIGIQQRIGYHSFDRLRENYEEAPGQNLSRDLIYNDYQKFAAENELEVMNSASFGKLIRAIFTAIQTRRLGVRGQSKYHYNGIRLRNGEEIDLSIPTDGTR